MSPQPCHRDAEMWLNAEEHAPSKGHGEENESQNIRKFKSLTQVVRMCPTCSVDPSGFLASRRRLNRSEGKCTKQP